MKLPNKRDLLIDLQDGLYWLKDNWRPIAKRVLKYALIATPVLVIIWQFTYSSNRLPLFMKIDNISVGGQDKDRVAKNLNKEYGSKKVNLYIDKSETAFATPKVTEIGLKVDNSPRVEAINYPWYFKLIPTSALWMNLLIEVDPVKYESDEEASREFVVRTFGRDCHIEPVNPSVEVAKDQINVVPGSNGGNCHVDEVVEGLVKARPILGEETDIRLKAEIIEPAIALSDLKELVNTIEDNLHSGVSVKVADEQVKLDSKQLRSWLEFQTDGEEAVVTINADKSGETISQLMSDKLAQPAGVTKVTTHDFTETGRQEGPSGQEMDLGGTLANIVSYLTGSAEEAVAATSPVAPKVEYTRSYSPTHAGLSALIHNYAADKPGTYGVSMVEVSGSSRSAGVNENQKFTTASTYKVYVAYSALRRIDSGEFKWGNPIVAGRNLDKCLDAMIAQSDNPCAEELVRKIGYTPLHNDVQGLGLYGTSFIDRQSFKTTAGDLSRFMAMLETGQLPLSEKSREKFIDILKRNVYRQGIPAGITGEVANKVGFLDSLLHDTAIVYSPKGTYTLTILTDGSSWANIADLTRQIESLR